MKKYLSGLITGIIISLSITVFAAEFNIIPNPYPILIEGTKTHIEAYNIDGSTYLKLKDLEKTGLSVKFENSTILINSTFSGISNLEADKPTEEEIAALPDGFTILPLRNDEKYEALPTDIKFVEFEDFNFPIEYNNEIYIDSEDLTLFKYIYSARARSSKNIVGILTKGERLEINISEGEYLNVYGHYYVKYSLFKEYE